MRIFLIVLLYIAIKLKLMCVWMISGLYTLKSVVFGFKTI